MSILDRLFGGRVHDPSVEDIVAQSRTVSTRLEAVADRLESAVERLTDDLNPNGETTADV